MLDIQIRNGSVIDGTGTPRRQTHVGIKDGRIVSLDSHEVEAAQVIDASGKVVSPGFVDIHTHFDAQAFWDPTLSPSPLHGVTSVIGGNCGFTIAPLGLSADSKKASDGEYLMRMLSRVEGMPLEPLREGVPWDWTTYGEFLDRMEGTLSINAGFMVGHSAIRRIVMGEDSVKREATPEELEAQKALLRDGIEAGGLGFSSSWARTHNDADGAMVPSRYANRDELVALAEVCRDFEGTSLELIPCIGPFEDWALDLMADMSAAAGRQLNWNVMLVNHGNHDDCVEKLRAGDVAKTKGGKVIALTVPVNLGVRLCFASGFGLDALPDWEKYMFGTKETKMELLSDPEGRRHLDELSQQPSPLRGMADWPSKVIYDTVAPENEQYQGRRVSEIAEEEGKTPWDALCDIAVADELQTSFGTPAARESAEDWKARIDVIRDSRAVIGASDAGAHLDFLASFNYATYLLGRGVREAGALGLEEAIQLMTDEQAQLYGLRERGRLEVGWHADVIVFDEDTVDSEEIRMKYDVPGGSGRLFAKANGMEHVICNGQEIVRHGEFTDARPGSVLRAGKHTYTPDIS